MHARHSRANHGASTLNEYAPPDDMPSSTSEFQRRAVDVPRIPRLIEMFDTSSNSSGNGANTPRTPSSPVLQARERGQADAKGLNRDPLLRPSNAEAKRFAGSEAFWREQVQGRSSPTELAYSGSDIPLHQQYRQQGHQEHGNTPQQPESVLGSKQKSFETGRRRLMHRGNNLPSWALEFADESQQVRATQMDTGTLHAREFGTSSMPRNGKQNRLNFEGAEVASTSQKRLTAASFVHQAEAAMRGTKAGNQDRRNRKLPMHLVHDALPPLPGESLDSPTHWQQSSSSSMRAGDVGDVSTEGNVVIPEKGYSAGASRQGSLASSTTPGSPTSPQVSRAFSPVNDASAGSHSIAQDHAVLGAYPVHYEGGVSSELSMSLPGEESLITGKIGAAAHSLEFSPSMDGSSPLSIVGEFIEPVAVSNEAFVQTNGEHHLVGRGSRVVGDAPLLASVEVAAHEQQKKNSKVFAVDQWRDVAIAAAHAELAAELEERLHQLARTTEQTAADEAAPEIEHLKDMLRSREHYFATQSDDTTVGTTTWRLQQELQDLTGRARRLWASADAQDQRPRQTEASATASRHVHQGADVASQSSSAASDDADETVARAELCEARRACSEAEEVVARANSESSAAQERSRALNLSTSELQNRVQAIKVKLEEQNVELCSLRERGISSLRIDTTAVADKSAKMHAVEARHKANDVQIQLDRLQAEANSTSQALAALREQTVELDAEATRLRREREAALEWAQQRESARRTMLSRLAALTNMYGEQKVPLTALDFDLIEADLDALVEQICCAWTDARSHTEQQILEQSEFASLWGELSREQPRMRQAEAQAQLTLSQSLNELEAEEWERARKQHSNQQALGVAKAELELLRQSRAECLRIQPQLAALVEELRVLGHEGAASQRELADRLAVMQSAIMRQRRGSCGSDVGSVGSDAVATFGTADVRGVIDGTSDVAGIAALKVPNGPVGVAAVTGGSAETEDEFEKQDLLRRVRALESEKADLIAGQEDLIRLVKAKVEPLQRVIGQAR